MAAMFVFIYGLNNSENTTGWQYLRYSWCRCCCSVRSCTI